MTPTAALQSHPTRLLLGAARATAIAVAELIVAELMRALEPRSLATGRRRRVPREATA